MGSGEGDSTSRSLLERACLQEAQAWDRLTALYTPLIEYWCRGVRVPEADVADVRQEVLSAVAVGLPGFDPTREKGSFRGWLRTITRNKISDYWRRTHTASDRGVGGSEHQEALQQVPADPPDELDAETRERETDLLFRRALEIVRSDFTEQTYRAFYRVVIDGQPTADIADELGMTANAVRLAKSRVLALLRTELDGLVDDRPQSAAGDNQEETSAP